MSTSTRTLDMSDIRRLVKQDRHDPDASPGDLPHRPRSRAHCIEGIRPCPWVGCRFNLFLDVNPKNGSIKLNHPGLEPEDIDPERSCALDVVDRNPDGMTLEDTGMAINTTRERVRQIEDKTLAILNNMITEVDMERVCACGCGEKFTTNSNRQIFVNNTHGSKFRQQALRANQKAGTTKTTTTAKENTDMAGTRSRADYERMLIEQVNKNKALSEQNQLLGEELEKAKTQAEAAKLNDQDAARVRGLRAEVERLEGELREARMRESLPESAALDIASEEIAKQSALLEIRDARIAELEGVVADRDKQIEKLTRNAKWADNAIKGKERIIEEQGQLLASGEERIKELEVALQRWMTGKICLAPEKIVSLPSVLETTTFDPSIITIAQMKAVIAEAQKIASMVREAA